MTAKRTVQIGVRMTEDQHLEVLRAAAKKWPGALMSDAGIVLSLALLAAKQILREHK